MDEITEQIIRVANDLYLKSGQVEGHDLDNWLEAEKLVLSWYEPDQEREKHVGATVPASDDHVIAPTCDEIQN